MEEKWISTDEAAQKTGYEKEYVRTLARTGKVTSKKFGFAVMIEEASLMNYYRSQRGTGD